MSQASELKSLIDELDRIHSGALPWQEEVGMPDFVTAENGLQRHFTQKARTVLRQFSKIIHENRSSNSRKIELEEYEKIVRQAVADMHAAGEFSGFEENDQGSLIPKIKTLIEDRLASTTPEYTHYFPAWTLGMERDSPFSIGPVTIFNRFDWIDAVDFPKNGKEHYLNQPEANNRWKEILKEALQKPKDSSPIEGLASAVYGAVRECPALVKVTVLGYEKSFSRKLARLAAKTALDAISLGFGAPECFQQQALHEERLPPVGTNSLVETKGFLWLPGSSIGQRLPSAPHSRVKQALMDLAQIFPAFGEIIEGLLDPSKHAHPKLANRWATALDWFGEGCRESSDAIALAKLGTCLDVLSCGGKYNGIKDMVAHLTGISEDTQVIHGDHPRTLKQLVKDIYDSGRSKILHGTHYDRLESFAAERKHAVYLARIMLIEAAIRLRGYKGQDEDKAFRTM
ncbi:hypothetical protein LJ655_08300 [Paraburkholderia sp. MMS20-SJTN17]|uniref:Apea-like HEPN domain-containing protein n=1 Tax=Paraburkholderia translucens TaxID=2886945 RepID=A0ABS8KBU3_9BURK|nr:HEPN domain-containing protein [Paraburkholderia sp. MMS20-SJTN17]MCC8401892.1 hypothetical protein [Paraburkholderia sp. MMS20-SJTN17]